MAGTITGLAAAAALGGSELLEISQPSTTVTITAATISAQASDNSYNDSGSGFVTAGFAVGDRIIVTGFTGSVVNNILVGVLTAVAAGKLTVGGSDGDVIVDETAGDSVTISKWVSRRLGIDGLRKYDVPLSFAGGPPTSSQVIGRLVAARDIAFAANFSGSYGYIATNPTSSFVISVQDNGTEIGTITIATDGTFAFATTSGTAKTVSAGHRIEFVAPSTADATAADIAATLLGYA